MKRILNALTALLAALSISAVGQTVPASAAADANSTSAAPAASADSSAGLHERNPRYQLRKGDSFEMDLPFSPEFNQTVPVQPDGFVTLKGVGSVFVEGQTVPELTSTLKSAYAKILHDPVITISMKDFEKPYFIAAGQVGRPGKYELRSAITVTEAVAIAGGFNDRSKHSEVVLYRPTPGGAFEAKVLNIKKLLASHNLSEDVRLQPGDLVYVPQNTFSKVRPYIPSPGVGVGAYYNFIPY